MGVPFASKEDLFCEAAVVGGFVSREQIQDVRDVLRAKPGTEVGQFLLSKGLLSEEQCRQIRGAVDRSWSQMHPAEADPLIGRTIAGEFRLDRLLGRGGAGAVYLGEQVSLRRPVAVKLLPLSATAEPSAVERFQREAVAAARLTHPNVVQVYFFGQHEGQYFIAMEYVEGETLHAVQARQGRIPAREVARVAREVARGLSVAHAQGIVHRDVKPENIFVGKGGMVKLGDFGLARGMKGEGHVSIAGSVLGTPYYMPPEQCRGEKVDARADLYALGATMFHLLVGRPPYEGANVLDILNRQVESPVPAAGEFGPDAPQALVELIQRMMAKAPAGRPASADEVGTALEAFLSTGTVALAPRAKASRTPLLAAAAGVLVVGAGVYALTHRGTSADPKKGAPPAAHADEGKASPTDMSKFTARWVIQTDQGWVDDLAFSPNGKVLASAGHDGTVRLYDTAEGKELRRAAVLQDARCVAFGPDGRSLAIGGDHTLLTWDVGLEGRPTRLDDTFRHFVWQAAYARKGGRLVSCTLAGDLRLYALGGGAAPTRLAGSVFVLAPKGAVIACGVDKGGLRAYDLEGGKELWKVTAHTGDITSLASSPDGKELASASTDATVGLWDWGTGKALGERFPCGGQVLRVAFSADGRSVLASGRFHDLPVIDAATGRQAGLLRADQGSICSLRMSDDGRMLASGGDEGSIILWALGR